MSVNINADTTNGLVLTSDTTGEIKLQSAGADIATVDSSGITMASGKTLPASALTGALPALDGSSLTGITAPAWKVLSDTTITSATASVSYDLGDYSSYEQFRILLNGVVPDTDARHMRILLGVNGSGYAETNFYGNSRVHMVDNGSVHRIRVNQQNWHNNAVGSAANEGGVTMNLYLANYNNTSYYKQIHGTFAIVSDNGTCMPGVIAQSAGATTIDSIQFKFNTGSIESGRFTLLGQEA